VNIRPNSIVSGNELNTIWQQMNSAEKGLNPRYKCTYIQKLKNEEKNKKDDTGKVLIGIEKHHIIPRFDGGTDDPSNLVLVSIKEHVIAHWLRWKVLEKPQDYAAFLFRIGDTEEAIAQRNLAIRAARERDKIEGRFMHDSEWQREMGKKGGARGGSANTEKQYQARQKVGLEYGRKTGRNNQSKDLSYVQLYLYSIWAHSVIAQTTPRVKDRGEEFYCIIEPKPAFVDVVNSLNLFVPDAIRSSSSFYKLINKKRNQMYGWRIVSMLTRSEVREGIQNFYNENPEFVLHFEQSFLVN
jgi:general stress protein YciG